jgi:hypothetical protein
MSIGPEWRSSRFLDKEWLRGIMFAMSRGPVTSLWRGLKTTIAIGGTAAVGTLIAGWITIRFMRWELPRYARADAIEIRYQALLISLRESAGRFEDLGDYAVLSSARNAAEPYLNSPEIIAATISRRRDGNRYGSPIKVGSEPVGSSCWFWRDARPGVPSVNHWKADEDEFVEYIEAIVDSEGTETYIHLTINLARMHS